MFNRLQDTYCKKDLYTKMVFVSGPRQVGKTALAKSLFPKNSLYLNFDDEDDRKLISRKEWARDSELIIFDEIHKKPKWKSWIKGVYDKEGITPKLLLTGSSHMEVFKKGSDSLAGRYFYHRLHPFSVAELKSQVPTEDCLEILLTVGGFPDPFTKGSEAYAKRWRGTHLERIVREDLLTLEYVRELKKMELLVDLLAERVGSTISYANLARDLEVSPHTVKKWISILESLYVIFVVYPFVKGVARSILKEPKVYFFDTGRVHKNEGARLENVVASSLLKRNNFIEDTLGDRCDLYFLRDKSKREVDFAVTRDKKLEFLVEVKTSDDQLSPALNYFSNKLAVKGVQIVKELKREKNVAGIAISRAAKWLSELEI